MKFIKQITLIFGSLYLLSCASAASLDNMKYTGNKKSYPSKYMKSISLDLISGGTETSAFLNSEIDGRTFKDAVKESLKAQGLYSEKGSYKLGIKILAVDQPMMGLDMKVTTVIEYILKRSGKQIFKETITAPFTATFGDHIYGPSRLKIANEGSAKKNIEMLLEFLSKK